MENELKVYENKPLTAGEIRAQVNLIQEVMKAVMKEGTHFGTVPGCGDKNTLLKPGAEKIMATFRLAADPKIEELSTSDCFKYRVIVRLLSSSGNFVGAGVGECSTDEKKYKWRASICDQEFNETPEDRRQEEWRKGYNGKPPFKAKMIRTNPADLANTVLKMAKKRALVDAVLTATAASDIFTQDIEDLPEELRENADAPQGKPPVKMPQPTPQQPNTDAQSSGDMAQDIIDNMGGVPETEYMSITQAKSAQVGNVINVKAKVVTVKSRKVGQGKDITDYGAEDADGARITISKWELCPEGVAAGVECFFLNVKVSDYRGSMQYVAQEIVPC